MSPAENPPAFPQHPNTALQSGWPGDWNGMTLRDHFAGQAIGAVIRQCANDDPLCWRSGADAIEEMFARKAFKIADAMLAERMKRGVA